MDKLGIEQPPRKLPGEIGESGDEVNVSGGTTGKGGQDPSSAQAADSNGKQEGAGKEEASSVEVLRRPGVQTKQYPLATLVIVALIAFLIGSLLRSLLTPADFIYVVTNMKEAEEANKVTGGGWREIRRLLEIKYVLGGWDFQIAAVRRHM